MGEEDGDDENDEIVGFRALVGLRSLGLRMMTTRVMRRIRAV